MSWLERYRLRHYFANSIWIYPVLGALAAIGLVRLLHDVERELGWTSPVDPDTARAVLGTIASSLFTSIVFVGTALLVAVQLASANLSPRIIGLVFRDPITKLSLTMLAFSFTLSLSALIRVTAAVPLLTAHTSAYMSFVSLAIFLYLIDHLGKALRPSGALMTVARRGRKVIEAVYPHLISDSKTPSLAAAEVLKGEPTRTIRNPKDGAVLAFDVQGLVALAARADCVIELVPQVGDFIACRDPLFQIFQGGESLSAETLCQSVAVGQERTPEQDPAFAFRIIVDIASKGLSPAINDPTTAVLALDQIHHLLRTVGLRRLDDERVRDATGRLRLAYRTPDWEDFVELAVTEIRQFGGTSIQIARRLRAMLENLIETLPEQRAARLRIELEKLPRSTKRFFHEPADVALADIADLQGVGGKRHTELDSPSRKQ
jgi:uncharacterized membrane protein